MLPIFIEEHLAFAPKNTRPTMKLLDLYSSLGVNMSVAAMLSEMQVLWANGRLDVSEELIGSQGLYQK
eukprot:10984415-Lingulodinium_polyedra.AAC.1